MGVEARADARVAGQRAIEDRVQSQARARSAAAYGGTGVNPAVLLTRPLVNMAMDPARRQNVADSAQGFVDDVQEVPNLDWGQVGSDTAQSVQQGVRDLPQTAGAIATHLPEIVRAMTYGPWVDEENAQQRLDRARLMGDEAGMSEAAGQANESTALAGLNVAAPLLFSRPMSVARAAGTAAALDAPFALSRDSDQSLQERLPDALTEIGGSGAFAGGMQASINAAPQISRILPSRGAQMVARMDRAGATVDAQGNPIHPRGVTPSFATANNGAGVSAGVTNMVADNIFAGIPSRGRLRQAATEIRDAVHDVRNSYGRTMPREAAGRRVQQVLERYANERNNPNPTGGDPLQIPTRDIGFASKAQLVFDDALAPIASNPARLTNTNAELRAIMRRADHPEVRGFNADRQMVDFSERVARITRGGQVTLRDLRELRRGIREAQNPMRRMGPETVDNSALQRIEASLTRDIYEAAGPAADRLRLADQYYKRGMARILTLMSAVDPENPSATIQAMIRAASRRTENTRTLAAIRGSMPDDEWRMIAASIIDELGTPAPGASGFVVEQNFDVRQFARAYRQMTPRARRILFGSRGGQGGRSGATMRQLADDLDNLAEVANAQKSVAAGTNTSGSAFHLQNAASIGLALNPSTMVPLLLGVFGGVLTGEMLTNPAFVRWLVSAQRQSGGSGGMRASLAKLRDLAARDPALVPAVAALESRLQEQQSPSAPQSAGSPALPRRSTEPAYQ